MRTCPKCGGKIPFYKLLLLTNYKHITCSSCGRKLYANKKMYSLMGGIGALIGYLIVRITLFKVDISMWIAALIAVICLLIFSIVISIFIGFEDRP